ncbi:MAG: 3-oxoacyl-[acyl-carrier-protein] reductase FabG [Phycisphaerae bacterium]|nr:3-oxoacyl-[acyl-carrier-protein] reductase FabG [Phycisphaerae bacterium]
MKSTHVTNNPQGGTTAGGNGDGEAPGWRESVVDLSAKVAVVTGGARGIGWSTCIALAREGIRAVGVVDMAEDLPASVEQLNAKLGRSVLIPYRGDVTNGDFRRQVFADLEKRFGCVSICVPAAGITRDALAVRVNKDTGEPEVYSETDFRRVIEIDLTAPIYWSLQTIASVTRSRLQRGVKRWTPEEPIEGCIILIGSVSSTGNRGQISYATAKAGLEGAQATLAAEAIYHGVRCAIIHPGYTDTAMVRALGEDYINSRILPQTQLNRLIRPEEIAHAIVFMIRNAAVSGQLWVDAGWHPAA